MASINGSSGRAGWLQGATPTELEWKQRLDEAAGLGVSIAEYCEDHDLDSARAYYWSSEIRRRCAARHELEEAPDPDSAEAGVSLIPVRLVARQSPAAPLRVLLPSGAAIDVSADFDVAVLRKVIGALEIPSC